MEKKEKFVKSIQENEKLIYKIASFYTDSKNDRDDLVQEIIFNLWKSFDTFKQNSSLSTWMYRVAMNVSVFHLKKSKQRVVTLPLTHEISDFSEPPLDSFEENWLILKKQIQHLNLLDKGILMLYLESKSHEEIAEITGMSKSNVGTKLSRIKDKLKRQILQ